MRFISKVILYHVIVIVAIMVTLLFCLVQYNLSFLWFIPLFLVFYILSGLWFASTIWTDPFYEYTRYTLSRTSDIPSVIYTYWHNDQLPDSVRSCINSWKQLHPGYTIHVITKDTLSDFVPEQVSSSWIHATTPQRFTDFLRLYLLSTKGGIWMDASIRLNRPLDWVHAYQRAEQSEYVGFEIKVFQQTKVPVIDSWFMASIPNSSFMKDWYDQFHRMNRYKTVELYVDHLAKKTNLQGIDRTDAYYLAIHVAVLSLLPTRYKLSLLIAENGPFLYLAKTHMLLFYLPFIIYLFRGKESPIIKYRSGERNFLEKWGFSHYLE
jgi:hypothetical protein